MEKLNISSSIDSDVDKSDSDVDKLDSDVDKSDSEPESDSSSTTVVSVQYMLPHRNSERFRSSTNRPPMDRMAATNKGVRMKHGITARDIIFPLNRNTTTPSNNGKAQRDTTTSLNNITTHRETTTPLNSDTTHRETTTPLNSDTTHRETTTPLNSDTTHHETTTPLNSGTVERETTAPLNSGTARRETTTPLDSGTARRETTTALDSGTARRETTTALDSGTARRETTTSLYSVPEKYWFHPSSIYMSPKWLFLRSSKSSTAKSFTSSNSPSPIPPYRAPYSPPPFRPPYCALSNTSQASVIRYTYQTPRSPIRSQLSSVLPPSYPPPYRPPYCASMYTSQTSIVRNTSQTHRSPIIGQLSTIPPYRPQSPPPPYRLPHSMPSYRSQISTMRNTSQTVTFSLKSRSSVVPPYVPPCSPPPYHLSVPYYPPSSVPISTSGSSTLISTFRSSTSTHRFQSTTSSHSSGSFMSTHTFQSSTSTHTSQSSTSNHTSQSSTSNHTSQSSTSTHNTRSSTAQCIRKLSGNFNASASYSDYTFPQSTYYVMPVEGAPHMVVSPTSTYTSYASSKYNLIDKSLWPMEMGSTATICMENLWSMLVVSVQSALPPLSKVLVQDSIWPSTVTCNNDNGLPSTVASRCSWSTSTTREDANALLPENQQTNDKLWKLIYSCVDGLSSEYAEETNINSQLYKAFLYFNKMEIVDVRPSGVIKCVIPAFKFEVLERTAVKNKVHLVNMYHQFMKINKLFACEYDYTIVPRNRIDIEDTILIDWLNNQKIKEHFWFIKYLSYFELENVNPTNIQNFIRRSERNMTISLEDQLKICCIVKKIKERPVTLMGILLFLEFHRTQKTAAYKEPLWMQTAIKYLEDIVMIPFQNFTFDNKIQKYIAIIIEMLTNEFVKLLSVNGFLNKNCNRRMLLKFNLICLRIVNKCNFSEKYLTIVNNNSVVLQSACELYNTFKLKYFT